MGWGYTAYAMAAVAFVLKDPWSGPINDPFLMSLSTFKTLSLFLLLSPPALFDASLSLIIIIRSYNILSSLITYRLYTTRSSYELTRYSFRSISIQSSILMWECYNYGKYTGENTPTSPYVSSVPTASWYWAWVPIPRPSGAESDYFCCRLCWIHHVPTPLGGGNSRTSDSQGRTFVLSHRPSIMMSHGHIYIPREYPTVIPTSNPSATPIWDTSSSTKLDLYSALPTPRK